MFAATAIIDAQKRATRWTPQAALLSGGAGSFAQETFIRGSGDFDIDLTVRVSTEALRVARGEVRGPQLEWLELAHVFLSHADDDHSASLRKVAQLFKALRRDVERPVPGFEVLAAARRNSSGFLVYSDDVVVLDGQHRSFSHRTLFRFGRELRQRAADLYRQFGSRLQDSQADLDRFKLAVRELLSSTRYVYRRVLTKPRRQPYAVNTFSLVHQFQLITGASPPKGVLSNPPRAAMRRFNQENFHGSDFRSAPCSYAGEWGDLRPAAGRGVPRRAPEPAAAPRYRMARPHHLHRPLPARRAPRGGGHVQVGHPLPLGRGHRRFGASAPARLGTRHAA